MNQHSTGLKLTVLLVSSLTVMSMVTISAALPQMASAFSYVENADLLVKVVLTLPALFIAISAPIAGRLIDRYGRLKLLYLSLLLYAIAGASGFFLENIYHILIGRAVLGIAVGFSMTVVNTLVADYFDGPERQKFVGLQVAFMSIGGILFIGLGGVLADIGWQYPFLIYLFSLLVLPMAMIYLTEPAKVADHADLSSSTLKSPDIIWLLFFNMMFMWVLFFLIPIQVPFHLNAIGIEKNALIGAAIALSTLFSAISSFSYSRIKDKFSFYTIFAVGYLLMALAFVLVGFAQSYIMVAIGMMISGLGMGLMIPNTNIWVMKLAPPQIRGREIGRLTTFWFFGQFASPFLLLPLAETVSISYTFYLAGATLFVLSLFFLILQMYSSGKKPVENT